MQRRFQQLGRSQVVRSTVLPSSNSRLGGRRTSARRVGAFAALLVGVPLAAASPASAAVHSVEVSGVVICTDGSWAVQGVWVENMDGGDGFAQWWAFPGKSNAAKYRITISADRPDPLIRLEVGCGGDGGQWRKTLLTQDFRTRDGFTKNRRCDVGEANRSRSCVSAPYGPMPAPGEAPTPNQGIPGYCTWGAYEQWHRAKGYHPNIGGDASEMDDNARRKGFQVSSVPHVKAMVVFDDGWPGHVGWVTDVRKGANGVTFDYIDMNGGTGGTAANDYKTSLFGVFDAKVNRAWDPAVQAFIVAPT